MSRRWLIMPFLAVLLFMIALPGFGQSASRQPATALAPTWEGALETGGARLGLVLHLHRTAGGGLAASLDSVDQGAMGLPVDAVTLEGDTVRLEMARLGAAFEGRLGPAHDTITGTWSQGGAELPLTFRAIAAAPTVSRPQEPRPPFPYRALDVVVPSHTAGVTLAGTLTLPPGPGPFPALVLITGSGPEDRDEAVFGHRPFLVIADHLTRAGLAVLRCDDRGVGGSSAGPAGATSADLVADVLGEVAFLKARPEIDPARVGLLGHSEGGLVATMAAATSAEPAFVVLLAAPGLRGDRLLSLQAEALGRAAGLTDAALAANARINTEVYRAVVEETDDARARARIRTALAAVPDLPEAGREAQIRTVLSPWFRYFLSHDPGPDLARVRVPVLALTGERDLQVVPGPNLGAIHAALDAAGHDDHEVRELPRLNHLLQECRTGAIFEYATIEQTVAPAALEALTTWLQAHTARALAPTPAQPGGPLAP